MPLGRRLRVSRRRIFGAAETLDDRVTSWLASSDRTTPGRAQRRGDTAAELLEAARRADAETVTSFAAQPGDAAALRAYQRSSAWLLATGIRGYRLSRRVRSRR